MAIIVALKSFNLRRQIQKCHIHFASSFHHVSGFARVRSSSSRCSFVDPRLVASEIL